MVCLCRRRPARRKNKSRLRDDEKNQNRLKTRGWRSCRHQTEEIFLANDKNKTQIQNNNTKGRKGKKSIREFGAEKVKEVIKRK